MSNFLSSIQSHAGTLATIAVGAIIARAMSVNATLTEGQVPTGDDKSRDGGHKPGEYKPTPTDVIIVRIMLERAGNLPPELLDIIFDEAEYWPHSEGYIFQQVRTARDALRVVGGTAQGENVLLVRCPPIGFVDYRKVGEEFKTAPLPPKSVDGSAVSEPLQNLTLMEPSSSSTEPTREARREFFEGSMSQPPALKHPVRKIVFKLRSKDQGWGGTHADKGSYRGSWTWFEAGLEKFDEDRKCDGSCKRSRPSSPTQSENPESANPNTETKNFCTCGLQSVYPPVVASADGKLAYHHHVHPLENLKIQSNKTAHRDFLDHEVVWSWTDDIHPESPEGDHLSEIGRGRGTGTGRFVRSLKLGDVVTVWGKARFGGWCNYVESVKVEIYWAV
ncbi:hypothetical protein CkaCkLH20_03044 [Colletotrichum karsti]|uniref:Ankyrin repeat protein n=1 Tax=Colletotrichum karsti TaxID=1095194 RepID=A0A9P6IFB8_9PEZI|nr:uncharacterized protein CkaCkLH20_03044 [Colletotrichum karsti]KAF9879501.1 hypothetical protein CkaCkLH20_03044 [Colletotrichum karsti]